MLIDVPVSFWMPWMILPPGPMMAPIWSVSIWIWMRRGAEFFRSSARLGDRLGHLVQDVLPTRFGLLKRLLHDVLGQPGHLDVHLAGCNAVGRSGELEVHVAQVILSSEDVAEDSDAVAARVEIGDQTHRDARDRLLDRHTGVHQRHRTRADRRHRRRAVGLRARRC